MTSAERRRKLIGDGTIVPLSVRIARRKDRDGFLPLDPLGARAARIEIADWRDRGRDDWLFQRNPNAQIMRDGGYEPASDFESEAS